MVHPLSVTKLRDVLLDFRRWKVVCSLFASDVSPRNDADYRAWLRKHSHAHPGIEVLIALDGTATVGLLGRAYPVTPGTVVVFGPNEPHSLGYPCGWWMRFAHLWIEAFPNYHKVGYSVRTGRNHADLDRMTVLLSADQSHVPLDGFLAEVYRQRGHEQAVLRARVIGALSLVAAAIAERSELPTTESTEAFHRDVIEAVSEHIRAVGGARVSLSELARMSGYSLHYLAHMFRQQTGRTIHEYVDLCRTARVKELTDAGRSKTQISAALGFSCLRAFLAWEKQQITRRRNCLEPTRVDGPPSSGSSESPMKLTGGTRRPAH